MLHEAPQDLLDPTPARSAPKENWRAFVLTHGWRAKVHELAAILGQSEKAVAAVRAKGCVRLPASKTFDELFALWHGRAPLEADWPAPRQLKRGRYGVLHYEWQGPEIALLAKLVGQLSVLEIGQVLTQRLRERTGDPQAERNRNAVLIQMNRIGLQTHDLLGGIPAVEAAREIHSHAIVYQAINKGDLAATRVGKRLVIDRAQWDAWKAARTFPPAGYVPLTSLKEPLGIRSDKLSEWARMGYIPGTVRCNPYGVRGPSTQFGTWYIDPKVVKKLVADRRAGKPMPWHGKPMQDNLRVTYKLWCERQHPAGCATCRQIWGKRGAPRTWEAYVEQYPPLPHGAKRHLTMVWSPGLTLNDVAAKSGMSLASILRAIRNGLLAAEKHGRTRYVTRTDATRWIARRCPTGDSHKSWISLETATKQYFFTRKELKKLIADGELRSQIGMNGPQRGVLYVARQQCAQLREKIGYTEAQAAQRAGVPVPELRRLLAGVDWRGTGLIPLVTVQAVIKRNQSHQGITLEDAAERLGQPLDWVVARRDDGTIRVKKVAWDDRLYLTQDMFERLQSALQTPRVKTGWDEDWLRLSDAAEEAGVSPNTLQNWVAEGDLDRQRGGNGWRYHRDSIRARARRYWETVRFHRATPPAWLTESLQHAAPSTDLQG